MNLQMAVLWYGGRWTLLAPGARYDRYMSRQSAIDAAQRLAQQARRQGHDVEVLIQDIGGQLSAVALDTPGDETDPPKAPPPGAPRAA